MSLIVERHQYKNLSRTSLDGKRVYKCPDGEAVASVTTILDSTKDKTHLFEWRKRVGEENAKRITKEASGMGTRMHKYIENYINNAQWDSPGSNPYSQQAFKMAQTVYENALKDVNEIWGSEVSLYFPKITFSLPKNIGSILTYSFYIFLAGSAASILIDIDKFMIPQKEAISQTAFYAVAVFIATVVEIPGRAMFQIVNPLVAKALNENNEKQFIF